MRVFASADLFYYITLKQNAIILDADRSSFFNTRAVTEMVMFLKRSLSFFCTPDNEYKYAKFHNKRLSS